MAMDGLQILGTVASSYSISYLILVTVIISLVSIVVLKKKAKTKNIRKEYECPSSAQSHKSANGEKSHRRPTATNINNILSWKKLQEQWIKCWSRFQFWKEHERVEPPSHNEVQYPHEGMTSSPCIVGIDCEMVGVGRGGVESALARCSIVTIRDDDNDDVTVMYDVYVKPTKKVTDYRTQWSGITPQHLTGDNVKSLDECRIDVSELISSTVDGRMVIIVGHSLENDFDVLNLKHPSKLIRDTATYPPYMRPVRRRMYARKLSHLAKEHLDIEIQQNGCNNIHVVNNDEGCCKDHEIGHSSVEDAAAALLLYRKVSHDWEAMLGFPFRKIVSDTKANIAKGGCSGQGSSSITLYLDGSNLPMGLRRKKDCENIQYQVISKTQARGNAQVRTPVDWIGFFRSLLACSSSSMSSYQGHDIPPITKVVIMFDGASFKTMPQEERPKERQVLGDNLYLEVTDQNVEADDVLIERCRASLTEENNNIKVPPILHRRIATVDEVITLLSQDDGNQPKQSNACDKQCLDSYIVVRRKGGGRKSNKKLFEKLNLRRPEEGALCLLPSFICNSDRLRRNSLQIAKELKRANVQQLVEYEIRQCRYVRDIVVTDDILLADRVVETGAVVMSYRQLQQIL